MDARQSADIPQPARNVVDLARGFLARMRVGDGRERRQQIFTRGEPVEIEQLLRSETLIDLRERDRLSPIHQVQSPSHHQAAASMPTSSCGAPRSLRAPIRGRLAAVLRVTAIYRTLCGAGIVPEDTRCQTRLQPLGEHRDTALSPCAAKTD